MRYISTRYKRSEQTSNCKRNKFKLKMGKRLREARSICCCASPRSSHRAPHAIFSWYGPHFVSFHVFLRTSVYLVSKFEQYCWFIFCTWDCFASVCFDHVRYEDERIWIVVECLCCVSHWWRCVERDLSLRWLLNSILRRITSGFMLSGDIFAVPQSVSFDFSYWTLPLIFVLKYGFPPPISTSASADLTWNDS